jgi:hypothetical protein
LLKFEKNPNFNIKYLPNGREYLNSAKTGESGVENWICLNCYRFLGPIAEWEKNGESRDLVRLSGRLLVEFRHFFMVLPKYFFKICVTLKSLVA